MPKQGRYWLAAGQHAFAYVDGVLLDNLYRNKARARMKYCWRVTLKPKAEPKSDMPQSEINALWERLNRIERAL